MKATSHHPHIGTRYALRAIPSPRAVTMESYFDRGFSSTSNEILNGFGLSMKAQDNEVFGIINQSVQINQF